MNGNGREKLSSVKVRMRIALLGRIPMKVKFALKQAMKAQRGCIALLFP